MIVEIVEDDGLCRWKMQCEHGVTECCWNRGHEGLHENEEACLIVREHDHA